MINLTFKSYDYFLFIYERRLKLIYIYKIDSDELLIMN